MAIRVTNVTAQMLFDSPDIFRSLSHTLALTHEPFARKIRVANFTLQVLQIEEPAAQLIDNISFSDEVFATHIPNDFYPLVDTLLLTDQIGLCIDPNPPGGGLDCFFSFEDQITFVQTTFAENFTKEFIHPLGLHDHARYCFGAPWSAIEITHDLGLLSRVTTLEPQSITDTIVFVQNVDLLSDDLSHFIDFVQEVSVGRGGDIVDVLSFSQLLETQNNFLRVVEDANFIEHAMTYFIEDGCTKKEYKQFSGEGSAAGIPDQRLVFDANMALEATTANDLLILRNPETDDIDRIGFNRINRETRGGELNVFGDPNWAKVNTLLFTIVALADGSKNNCPDVIVATLDFFQNYLGEEIILHDHTGTSWRGVVTTPNERATEDADGWWTIAFEFEGVAEPGSVPQNAMVLTDTLTFNADWARGLSNALVFTEVVTVGGDINISVSDTINFIDGVTGVQEIDILHDDFTAGSAVDLHGTSPTIGTSTWSAHEDYQDDGTVVDPVRGGGYYPFTPVSGTFYELTFETANVVTYLDGFNCIWGFYEGVTTSNVISGPTADGTVNPTAAKAVHLQRNVGVADRDRAYRRGSDSDGTADTIAYTDATLRDNADNALDLRLELDTTGGAGNWTARWLAKDVVDSVYTEVGPATSMLSENVGAVGFSTDSGGVELTTDDIRLKELRPI